MQKSIYLFVMLVMALTIVSCKKEKEPTPQENIVGRWRLTSQVIVADGMSMPASACELDNIMEFRAGGVLIIDEGSTKCDANEPQSIQGSWTLSSDGKSLTLTTPDMGNIAIVYQVVELTKTTLKIKVDNILGSGASMQASFTKI